MLRNGEGEITSEESASLIASQMSKERDKWGERQRGRTVDRIIVWWSG